MARRRRVRLVHRSSNLSFLNFAQRGGPTGLAYLAAGFVGVGLGLFGARLGETIQDLTRE